MFGSGEYVGIDVVVVGSDVVVVGSDVVVNVLDIVLVNVVVKVLVSLGGTGAPKAPTNIKSSNNTTILKKYNYNFINKIFNFC